jgi:hypothetical protein
MTEITQDVDKYKNNEKYYHNELAFKADNVKSSDGSFVGNGDVFFRHFYDSDKKYIRSVMVGGDNYTTTPVD